MKQRSEISIYCVLVCAIHGAWTVYGQSHGLISGGNDSWAGQAPWHVGIYVKSQVIYNQICGGTLVSPRIVISAQHCFTEPTSSYSIVAGTIKRSYSIGGRNKQIRNVISIVTHPSFVAAPLKHDIALVIMEKPMTMNSYVVAAKLDLSNQETGLSNGDVGIVAGWGMNQSGTFGEHLQYINLPYVDIDTCFASLPTEQQVEATNDIFCAGYLDTWMSVCRGDSGGGLMFPLEGHNFLRGVVSKAFGRHTDENPCYTQHYTAFAEISRGSLLEVFKGVPSIHRVLLRPLYGIGEGYIKVRGFGLYKFHEERLTWNDARKACIDEGAHLVIYKSLQEVQAVTTQLILPGKSLYYYVGIHDSNDEGHFVDVFGNPIRFNSWQNGEPNNAGEGEDCVILVVGTKVYNDFNCNRKIEFICQVKDGKFIA